MQVAANVSDGHKLRKPALHRRLDLAPVLPHLRRDIGQPKGGVDVLLAVEEELSAV